MTRTLTLPDSPIASSKNEQSQQHTKNETTITTINQSQNKTVSQSVGDPCAGIPLEVIGSAFASSNALDDDISMMSCSIMRICNDPLETWVERKANANNTFPWQPNNNERWEHCRQDGEEDDDFTRVSI